MRRRVSPSLVVAVVALVLSCTGGAVAAGYITGSAVKDGSLTGKDIKNRSLTPSDFRGSVRGPRGFDGPEGPVGPQGPPGPSDLGQLTIVDSPQSYFGVEVVTSATAFCPPGQRAVSGGGVSISDEQLAASEPTNDRSGWFVIGVDRIDNGGEYVQARVVCAPTGKAVAASAPARAGARAEVARLVQRFKAARR